MLLSKELDVLYSREGNPGLGRQELVLGSFEKGNVGTGVIG